MCVAFIFITTACYSEYDTSKLGGAAGAYLCAVDMLERFLNSECGYIVKKKYTYEETLDEVLSVFNHKERMEMVRFVNEVNSTTCLWRTLNL